MRWVSVLKAAAVAGVVAIAVTITAMPSVTGQTRTSGIPRLNGKPDLNGLWQTINTANWDIQAHSAKPALAMRPGPVVPVPAKEVLAFGAVGAVPAGLGVVDGNDLPYLPEALKKKEENQANWLTRDPEIKCYLPGVPRATYMPYPFQIVQSADNILFTYEFASASRIVRMNSQEKSPAPAWMGWNIGRWDGESLVIDVTDQMEETWFDRAGNYHSDALKVSERYTAIDAHTLQYEATIEDPKVFSKPWKMSMPLYRRREPNARLMEYKCVEFAEELMYGHLRKR